MDATTQSEKLTIKAADLHREISSIEAAVEAENRSMNTEEIAKVQTLNAQFKALTEEIDLRNQTQANAARLAEPQSRIVTPMNVGPSATVVTSAPATVGTVATGGNIVAHNFSNHGFTKGAGEFFLKVREASITGRSDPRLMVNTVSTYNGETVGADGGFALPPQFASGIMQTVFAEDSFLNALQPVQTSSNLLVVPTDEDPPWGASGITAAKTAEAGAITASKAVIKKLNIVMHSIKALVHVSEESLSDIPFLASFVQNKIAEKLRWKMETYAMNGTGLDEPLGILNAPGIYALTDGASTATVIGAVDVFAMKAAALPGSGAFWVVSPTILPALWSLKTDATAGYPLLNPDMSKAPEGMLLGLPVYKSEACPALGTTGDILLVVPNGYVLATSGGVNAATTVSFAFDQQLQSFRGSVRMGGAPTLSAKVTRANGSTYASNIIALTGPRS
jgi:HK97 family phage major capsid protein